MSANDVTGWLVQLGCAWAVFLIFAVIDLPTILDQAAHQIRQRYAPPADKAER